MDPYGLSPAPPRRGLAAARRARSAGSGAHAGGGRRCAGSGTARRCRAAWAGGGGAAAHAGGGGGGGAGGAGRAARGKAPDEPPAVAGNHCIQFAWSRLETKSTTKVGILSPSHLIVKFQEGPDRPAVAIPIPESMWRNVCGRLSNGMPRSSPLLKVVGLVFNVEVLSQGTKRTRIPLSSRQ
jgi:hypothetical protein